MFRELANMPRVFSNLRYGRIKSLDTELTYEKVIDLIGGLDDSVEVNINYTRRNTKCNPQEIVEFLQDQFRPHIYIGGGIHNYTDATLQVYSGAENTKNYIKLVSGLLRPRFGTKGMSDKIMFITTTIDYLIEEMNSEEIVKSVVDHLAKKQ